jgi:predicted  nucleic acid-binding Zn-ribbon protein
MGAPTLKHNDKSLSFKQRYDLLLKLHKETVADMKDEIEGLEGVLLDRDDEITYLEEQIEDLNQELNNAWE